MGSEKKAAKFDAKASKQQFKANKKAQKASKWINKMEKTNGKTSIKSLSPDQKAMGKRYQEMLLTRSRSAMR